MEGAILKSFTYMGAGGNGAGVILLDKQITNNEKQEIAAKIGLSETAFIYKIEEDTFDVSFFTPVCEVDLCGHATIAAFYYLGLIGVIKGYMETKKVFQITKAGKLQIEIRFKENVDYVLMEQQRPEIFNEFKGEYISKIAKSLRTDDKNICLESYNINPTIVSTGLKDIMIPVKSREILNNLNADFDMINDISVENDVVGYHVYTIENNTIYTRNFAPRVGINEECATGTSNGALCSLLYKNNIISNESSVIQGEAMNETSNIFVSIIDENSLLNVYVGGRASMVNNILI